MTDTLDVDAPVVPALEAVGVTKSFGTVQALRGCSFQAYPGEVTALVGDNGAGKSTLVKVMSGVYGADSGTLLVEGNEAHITSPQVASTLGIETVYQDLALAPDLDAASNVYLGRELRRLKILHNQREMRRRTAAQFAKLGVGLVQDLRVPVASFSGGQRQSVAIARAAMWARHVIIMDEPTAALSRNEIDDLFRIIAQLKAEGRAVVFISHKFDEIFRVADAFVCLRDGERVGSGKIASVTEAKLVSLMVGRPIDQVFPKRDIAIGSTVLKVDGLSNATEFADISFELHRGEILGFYGLVGAGRSEAMQCLFGMTPALKGTISLNGKPLSISSPGDAIAAGISYVPEDRQEQGAVLPLGIRENITLASIASHVKNLFVSKSSELQDVRKLGKRLDVRAANWEQQLGELSGGNQQKVVIAKWLAAKPKVIILDEPTKGIDVGSKAAVHDFIGELAEEGLAVILVSSELPEIMGLADRVVVMQEGRIADIFTRGAWSAEEIVATATGAQKVA